MPIQLTRPDAAVADAFHQLYHHSAETTWRRNTFLGYPIWQCPIDMYTYQEVIARVRPAFVIQTGVAEGGSVLYLACLLDLIGAPPEAVVIGVDVQLTPRARTLAHPRIRLVEGDSTNPQTVELVRSLLPATHGFVSLDSDHTQLHVGRELAAYAEFVAAGGYLVVEDTNLNGHPIQSDFGPGPLEAVDAFLIANKRFIRDDAVWQRNLFSFHQRGWLKRIG